jgi:DHA1 family bicyclomycin/chloramphenicol resistance-like MFS transporter
MDSASSLPATRGRRIALGVLLTALTAMLAISTDMYAPAMPAVAAEFGADWATTQLTLSLFVAGFAVSQLVYGPLSDRFGRKPVLAAGVLIYLAASVACITAATIEELMVYRFLQSLGACAGPVLGRAVVRDIYGREGAARMLAYMGAAMGFFPIVSPILGGYLVVELGWRSIFIVVSVYAALALVGTVLVLHETNRWRDPSATHPARLARNYATLLGDRFFVGYTLVLSFIYAALFLFLSGSSLVLIGTFGLAPQEFGELFSLGVVCYVSGSFASGRLSARVGIDRLILIGSIVGATAGLAMVALALAGVAGTYAVVGPMWLFTAGLGLVIPNGMAGAIGPHATMAGTASAMVGFFQQGSAALIAALVGVLFEWTQMSVAVSVAAVTMAGLVGFYLCVWRSRGRTRAATLS